jgi:hypothetical protein
VTRHSKGLLERPRWDMTMAMSRAWGFFCDRHVHGHQRIFPLLCIILWAHRCAVEAFLSSAHLPRAVCPLGRGGTVYSAAQIALGINGPGNFTVGAARRAFGDAGRAPDPLRLVREALGKGQFREALEGVTSLRSRGGGEAAK